MGKLIGIGGVSRAGKTELANYLNARLENANVVSQDQFVRHESDIPRIRDRVDWETPESIDWESFKAEIASSASNFEITLIDGLFSLFDEEIDRQMSLKIYLSIDKDRFLKLKQEDQRWGEEPAWFIEHIWQSHYQYGLPKNDRNLMKFHNINSDDYSVILERVKNL